VNTQLKINIVSKSDLKIVIDLANEIWPICYKDTISAIQIQNLLDKIYSVENLIHEVEELGHVFWIAHDSREPVGYISAYVEENNLWIKKLYILPEKQGKGYGTQFMNTVENYFKNTKAICLLVNSTNKSAQAFYKAKGFEVIDTVPVKMGDYYFTDFVMKKEILRNHAS